MPLYRQPKSPYWWVRIGRKTRRSTGTTDRKQAEEFERVLSERLWRLHKLDDRTAISWQEAADKWLTDSPRRSRKRDREVLAWLAPKIGVQPLAQIACEEVLEQIRQDCAEAGWSHATADRVMGTMSAVMRASLPNPPKVPMYRAGPPEPRWLTPEEFDRLCKELPVHLELAARFAVVTMLRMRSMLALTWDRIDMQRRRAWIPGAQMKGRLAHGLPLSTEAMRLLRELRKLNPQGEHVFQWKGKPIDDCNTCAFQLAVARAKLAPLRWHDLRHTGASWAVQNGMTLQQLMEFGGWKSYAMVLRYSHLAPDHLASAAELVCMNVAYRKLARKPQHRAKA